MCQLPFDRAFPGWVFGWLVGFVGLFLAWFCCPLFCFCGVGDFIVVGFGVIWFGFGWLICFLC